MPTRSVLTLALVFASVCSLVFAQPPSKKAAKDDAKSDAPKDDADKKKADESKKGDAKKGDDAGKDKKAKPVKKPAAVVKFDTQFAEWKKELGELRALMEEYKTAKGDEDKETIEGKFNDLLKKARALEPALIDQGLAAIEAAPEKDANHYRLVLHQTKAKFVDGDFKETLRVAARILKAGIETPQLRKWAGVSAFNTEDFAAAVAHLAKTGKDDKPHEEVEKIHDEAAIRVAEAKENNLPRVILHTTKGDVVLELFENEAPNTVDNFISLVEKTFYNGNDFHRVNEQVAQGGAKGNGIGGPGYAIECECHEKDHRNHFRGVLSMAHAGKDTGGSQFFITHAETPHLDGVHTVFGRVLEGMDVVDKLQRTEVGGRRIPIDPDKILTAKVTRKREGSKYKPKKIDKKG